MSQVESTEILWKNNGKLIHLQDQINDQAVVSITFAFSSEKKKTDKTKQNLTITNVFLRSSLTNIITGRKRAINAL